MKRKVTGVVIALTMCLNSMPTTVMAESEVPQGGDVKAVSESGGQSEESGAEENTPTEEVDNSNGEKEEVKEEPTSENDTQQEETEAEEGEQEEKGEETNEEVKDSETPSADESNKQEEETKAETPTEKVQAVPLTAQEGIAVQADGITLDKISKNVVAGNDVEFTVTYSGSDTLTAEVKDGNNNTILATVKNNTVTVTTTESTAAGEYTLTVSDTSGNSATATITVAEAGAKFETSSGTIYYATLAEVFADKIIGGGTVIVLKDELSMTKFYIRTDDTGINLDLNGYMVHGLGENNCIFNSLCVGTDYESGKVTLVDTENDYYTANLCVNKKGNLTVNINNANSAWIDENKGELHLLSGEVRVNKNSTEKKMNEFLGEGRAYYYNRKPLEYADVSEMNDSSNAYYEVRLCDHQGIDETTGKCAYCNANVSVEWKSSDGTTKYFKNLETALEDSAVTSSTADTRGTLKILSNSNGEWLRISAGNFDLDLNGKTIDRLGINGGSVNIKNTNSKEATVSEITVNGGGVKLGENIKYGTVNTILTLKDLLADGMAVKKWETDAYLTEEDLNRIGMFSDIIVVKAPFYIMREPLQEDLDSIVYGTAESGLLTFAFSESGVNVRYKIGNDDEVQKGVLSDDWINLSDETKLWNLSAGEHKFYLSATYDGYTINRTYTFTVLQSGSNIVINNESKDISATYFDRIYINGRVEATGTAATSTNTNDISTYSGDNTLKSNYVELYEGGGKTYGRFAVNSSGYFYVSLSASELGAGEHELGLKYTGNENMADTKTADNAINIEIVKVTPTVSDWCNYPYGNKTYGDGSSINNPMKSALVIKYGDFEDTNYKYYAYENIRFNYYSATKREDGTYVKANATPLTEKPVNAGDYIVEAVFDATDGTEAATSEYGFSIGKSLMPYSGNPTTSKEIFITEIEKTYEIDLQEFLEICDGITENDTFTLNNIISVVGNSNFFKDIKIENGKVFKFTTTELMRYAGPQSVNTINANISSTNYNSIDVSFSLTAINKPEKNLNVTMEDWTYGDTAKTPVYTLTEANPRKETVSYAKKDGTVLNAVPTDAGEYTVTVKAEYDDYVYTGSADFTIAPKDISNATINLDHDSFVYNGEDQKPKIESVVLDGVTLVDYGSEIIYGSDAGTYTVKVSAIGNNYTGEAAVNWTITPKPVTPSVEVTGTYTYTGSEIKPTIVVKDGETVIPENEYNVSYESNTNAGTGKVIVTDKDGGNYIVNGEKEFTINKAEVTIKALDKDRRRGGGMLDVPATLAEGEDYTVSGLIGDDKLGGTISISFVETGDSSKYDINITAEGINENYTPVYEKGTLNIHNKSTGESDPSYTGGSSSSGGGSSSTTKNDVTVDSKTENGTIKIDKDTASKGSTVTITVTPDEGYEVDEIKVTDESGNEIEVTDKGNGKYTFTMPSTDVDIKADFKETTSDSEETEKTIITMQIGNTDVSVNEDVITNDVAPVIRNDRTLVPIRVVTETLGGKVDWNAKTKEVTLNIDGKEIKMTIGKTLEKYGVAPMIINDRTYVPIRFVAEELGAEVQWNEETKTVTIIKQ